MDLFNAEMWSAVAALFTAVTAWLLLRIERRNHLEAARPELVLSGWTRRPLNGSSASRDTLSFATIRNVGRGAALDIFINCFETRDNLPLYTMSTCGLPILATGESEQVAAEITVWWQNVPLAEGMRTVPVTLNVSCSDRRGRRYETTYSLMVVPPDSTIQIVDELVPGVMLTRRVTRDFGAPIHRAVRLVTNVATMLSGKVTRLWILGGRLLAAPKRLLFRRKS